MVSWPGSVAFGRRRRSCPGWRRLGQRRRRAPAPLPQRVPLAARHLYRVRSALVAGSVRPRGVRHRDRPSSVVRAKPTVVLARLGWRLPLVPGVLKPARRVVLHHRGEVLVRSRTFRSREERPHQVVPEVRSPAEDHEHVVTGHEHLEVVRDADHHAAPSSEVRWRTPARRLALLHGAVPKPLCVEAQTRRAGQADWSWPRAARSKPLRRTTRLGKS